MLFVLFVCISGLYSVGLYIALQDYLDKCLMKFKTLVSLVYDLL